MMSIIEGIPYWRQETFEQTNRHSWDTRGRGFPKMAKPNVDGTELAKELDAKLDEYVDALPRTKYKGGLTEENWEEVVVYEM